MRNAMTHDDFDALLPLLVAGTLSDAQSRAVREHVAGCLDCRREQKHLAFVRDGVLANPISADALRPGPARVLERIDDFEEHRQRNPLSKLLRFGREHPLLALTAQAALIAMAVFLLVSPVEQEPPFVTLSQPEVMPSGDYVRAVFDPAVDDQTVAAVIASFDLKIVHGPTERGVYTLAPADDGGVSDYETLANALRTNDNVLFAERVTIGRTQ